MTKKFASLRTKMTPASQVRANETASEMLAEMRLNELQFGPHNASVLHSLHVLDEYPLLLSIATPITRATKLDGRACRHLYMTALHNKVHWNELLPREQQLMTALGLSVLST